MARGQFSRGGYGGVTIVKIQKKIMIHEYLPIPHIFSRGLDKVRICAPPYLDA